MKKLTKYIILLILLTVFTTMFSPLTAHATLKLNTTNKTMYIDDTYTLRITRTKQYILWKSSDKTIASVSKKGKVTAKAAGTCTITAFVGSGANSQKLTCKIKVKSRLSCKNSFIRCYSDEYESARIHTKNLSKYESLIIENNSNNIISAEWNEKSNYFDIIFVPKKLGITKVTVKIIYEKDNYFDIKNDSITFFIISYPDRTGWINSSKLDYYDLDFLPNDKGNYTLTYYYGQKNTTVAIPTRYELKPATDAKNGDIYSVNDLLYKIENDDYYFNTNNLEDIFFSDLI